METPRPDVTELLIRWSQGDKAAEHCLLPLVSVDETAAALGVSPRTVDGEWRMAKSWLKGELARGDRPRDDP